MNRRIVIEAKQKKALIEFINIQIGVDEGLEIATISDGTILVEADNESNTAKIMIDTDGNGWFRKNGEEEVTIIP